MHGRGRSGLVGWGTLAATLVAWLVWAGTAAAATKTWTGSISNAWEEPGNWDPPGVPSATDEALIDSGTPEVSAADTTVGSLVVSTGLSVTADRTLTVAGSATSTLAPAFTISLSHGTLRLEGTTVWSAGRVQIIGTGALVNAGTLQATGPGLGVDSFGGSPDGRRVLRVDGATQVSGSLAVGAELENDGTLEVLDGGALSQTGEVPAPGDSSGQFISRGSGVLSLSNVTMDATSSASGTGTIGFIGGTSRVLAGASYAAGITDIGNGGVLDLQTAAGTGALRFSGFGSRQGSGLLTVGSGQSVLGRGTFSGGGVTAFSPGSQTSIADTVTLTAPTAAPTLRLNGTTTWSAGHVQILDAGALENAGTLDVTGADTAVDGFDTGGATGRRVLSVLAGGLTDVMGSLAVNTELENDGTLQVQAGGSLVQTREVATPGDSGGAFISQGSGLLSLSNVSMAAGSSASGTGTIRFEGGTSKVLPGASFTTGITDMGNGGVLDLQAGASTDALRFSGFGTRQGSGLLTVGSGQSVLGRGTFSGGGVTAFSPGSQVSIADTVTLTAPTAAPTLRLNGTTIWSDGRVQILDAGALENAGTLHVTGANPAVDAFDTGGATGRRVLSVLAGGVTEVPGSLAVNVELENDGTLRVPAGGSLVQTREVATPGVSTGGFEAQGSGLLSLSNVTMGAGSSASGTGTIRFEGGTSHVLPGASYAAGITDIGNGGALDLQPDSTTDALRFSGFGTRGGPGRLTVGSGQSSLGRGTFSDGGVTAFTAGSQSLIDDTVTLTAPTAAPTLRLDGTTTWSGGHVQILDAGALENAGTLRVTGTTAGVDVFDTGGATGARELHNVAGTLDVQTGARLSLALPLEMDGGVLGGAGTIVGNVQNTGAVVSPATLTVTGDYTQGPSGALRAQIGPGAQYSHLGVGGTATLDGALQLVTAPGTDPAATDTFRILDAATRTGTFAAVTGAQATAAKSYIPVYDATGVTLTVSSALPAPTPPAPTPEPTPTPVPPPATGKTVNVAPERGKVTVRLPDGRTVPVDDTTQIVTGSVVDTRAGAVRLSTRGAGGKIDSGVFSDGLFRVTQSTGTHPVTELRLVEKLDCPRGKRARAATTKKKKKKKRRLWGDAKGSFRTRGQYGSAVNTGTKWMTEDRCDGTLFRVAQGVIRVTPNGSHRSVLVRAGHQRLVKRRP